MSMLSVIIPSLHSPYVQKTTEDLLKKAQGEIEIIVILDGYWCSPEIVNDKRVTVIHRGEQLGMRKAVNAGARLAKGKYIMKTDDHTMFGEGFDEIMKRDCGENEIMIPSRWNFDPEKWERGGTGPIEYLYMTFPYYHDNLYGMGLHGKKWLGDPDTLRPSSFYHYERLYADRKVDEIMATQGSCWFCHKKRFLELDGEDERHSYMIHQEPQELAYKFWLSGGRMLVNKNTFYCHWHKHNSDYKEGWRRSLSRRRQHATERYGTWYWMNDIWPKATRKMEWLIEHFWPIPGWPENWKEEKARYEAEHPEFCNNFPVFDEYGNDGLPLPKKYKEKVW